MESPLKSQCKACITLTWIMCYTNSFAIGPDARVLLLRTVLRAIRDHKKRYPKRSVSVDAQDGDEHSPNHMENLTPDDLPIRPSHSSFPFILPLLLHQSRHSRQACLRPWAALMGQTTHLATQSSVRQVRTTLVRPIDSLAAQEDNVQPLKIPRMSSYKVARTASSISSPWAEGLRTRH